MSASVRAMHAARSATLDRGRPTTEGITQFEAAERWGVGVRTIKRARRVLREGTRELIDAVDSGDLSVEKASEIATRPKEEQNWLIALESIAASREKISQHARKSLALKLLSAAAALLEWDEKVELVLPKKSLINSVKAETDKGSGE